MMLRSSTTKLFCETSFKNEAAKLKNEAFLRDFLQKWSYETQKRSFSARLPPKIMLRARIGSQATTKGPHHFRVAGVGLRAHLVTCDPIFFTSKRRNSDLGSQATNVPRGRHRVYRGSCNTSCFCYVDVAVSIGEAAKPRVFCYVDVAVSIGEAAKPRVFCCVDVAVSIVYRGSCKTSCLLLRGCRRVDRGSCKTSCFLLRGCRRVYRGSCNTSCFLLRGCCSVYRGSCKTSCLLLRRCRRVYSL